MTQLAGLRPDHEFESIIDREILLGEGTSRRVYAVTGCDDVVIKESKGPFHNGNFVEWTVWNAIQQMREDGLRNKPNEELKDLFAACPAISYSARYLMMERLTPIVEAKADLPIQKFPNWLNDKQRKAFGNSAFGSIKVMDYAMVDFYRVLNPKNWN